MAGVTELDTRRGENPGLKVGSASETAVRDVSAGTLEKLITLIHIRPRVTFVDARTADFLYLGNLVVLRLRSFWVDCAIARLVMDPVCSPRSLMTPLCRRRGIRGFPELLCPARLP